MKAIFSLGITLTIFLGILSLAVTAQKVNRHVQPVVKVDGIDTLNLYLQVQKRQIAVESFEIYFYRENKNLNQPINDSIQSLFSVNKLVWYVDFDGKVSVQPTSTFCPCNLRRALRRIGTVSKSHLFQTVTQKGSLDNANHSKIGFQVFVLLHTQRRIFRDIASNVFVFALPTDSRSPP